MDLVFIYGSNNLIIPRHYPNGKFLPVWEVSTRSGSYVVNLLDPNGKKLPYGKSDSYKMELELKYGFWNFNFFLD